MPLRTVTSALYVQYPFYETCFYVSKCSARISYLGTLVYYTTHQTSAALLNLQCQVLQNFHLMDIAICGSLCHRHGILFPTFDDRKSIQILISIYPGKKHSWLQKGSTEWFIVANSYPTAECNYKIHAPQGITLHHRALLTVKTKLPQ